MNRHASSLQWILVGLLIVGFVLLVLRELLAPVVLGTLATVILSPIHRRLERRLGEGSHLAALIALLLFTVVVGVPLLGTAFLFIFQARAVLQDFIGLAEGGGLSTGLTRLVDQYIDWLEIASQRYLGLPVDVREITLGRLQDLGAGLYSALPDALSWVGNWIIAYLVFNLVLYFLLRDGRRLTDLVRELSPIEPRHTTQILARLESTIRAVFFGGLATAVFQGSVGALGFALTGFESYVIWGLFLFIASFIPVVGTALVWLPAVVYLSATGHGLQGLMLLGFGVFISTTDNILRAVLIGRRTTLHPLILFLAVFGGLASGGPMGLVYGLLLAATLVEATAIYRGRLAESREGAAAPLP